MFLSLLLALACSNDLPERPGVSAPTTTSPVPETVIGGETELTDGTQMVSDDDETIIAELTEDSGKNAQHSAPAPALTAAGKLDPNNGLHAVAINSDGSLSCDGNDQELKNLHEFRGWITTPRTESGYELFVAAPVFPGKAQNGQAGKCVDSTGNVLFADHVRFTTSTSFVRPAAPPTDSPWFDKNRWGKEAEGKATELVATAGDLRVMCFDGTGARCVPAKYEPTKKKSEGRQIVITVPEGTEVKVGTSTGS